MLDWKNYNLVSVLDWAIPLLSQRVKQHRVWLSFGLVSCPVTGGVMEATFKP